MKEGGAPWKLLGVGFLSKLKVLNVRGWLVSLRGHRGAEVRVAGKE